MFAVQRQTAAWERKSGKRSLERAHAFAPPMPAVQRASCACGGGCPRCQNERPVQTKLAISQPGDVYEQDAERVADEVMRMPESGSSSMKSESSDEITAAHGSGSKLDRDTRSFMESRFGADFGAVNIHTASEAVRMSRELNARAFTIGNEIYFNEGQYRPDSVEGRRLLAHELTHTIQQRGMTGLSLQRKKYNGKDDAGFYEIDDDACTFDYRQDWYFNFAQSPINAADQPAFMASGKRQVENGWSHKYRLISGNKTCPCGEAGFTVDVKLDTFNQQRKGKHGYDIDVEKRGRSITIPPLSVIKTGEYAKDPSFKGANEPQDVMAHEFGHTIGLQDEYDWWASLFGLLGSGAGGSSLMNSGNQVMPWHYQHFADMLNLEMARCTFYPEGSAKRSSLAEPVSQLGFTTGALFNEASLDPSKAEFVIGLNIDARVSNDAVLGLFYPTLGFDTYLNVKDGKMTMGPTAGLRLNRLAHPLYLDVSTGVLFAPGDDREAVKLNVPLSTTLGIRGKGFNAGVNYTPMFDLLNGGKYSHIIGLNLQFDVK